MPFLLAAAMLTATCVPGDLALTTDGRDGDFNGMSHSGTYLVVRNKGQRTCTLPGLPTIGFRDASGRAVPAMRQAPAGMRPGPVVLASTLRPGAALATGLRWVSGPVHARSRCHDVVAVTMSVGRSAIRAPLRGHLCGEAGRPVGFDQPALGRLPA
jgi:hypothetical protein